MNRGVCKNLLACHVCLGVILLTSSINAAPSKPVIIDHNDVDITVLTEAQINRAKSKLHIVYGHTSHGSQITSGMSYLTGFANGGGKGMSFPSNIFLWNNGGSSGALDLHDGGISRDVGYWPQWRDETITYLNNPANADVNVVMWSWCGQVDQKYAAGTLTNEYLTPMSELEEDYPDVVFVYMTGHVDHWDDANNKAANQVIRDYCTEHNKVLYDFADIESYDPDGNYYEFPHDNCDYYATAGSGPVIGNWAVAWQTSHVENVDWYTCTSSHSEPLNANQKAYAAWALWCSLGGDFDRDGIQDEWEEAHGGCGQFGGGTNDFDADGFTDTEEYIADTNPTNAASNFCIAGIEPGNPLSVVFTGSANRVYSLECVENLATGEWHEVAGQVNQPGSGSETTLTSPMEATNCCFRVKVAVP